MLATDEFDSTLPKTGINVKEHLVEIFHGFGLEEEHLEKSIFTTDKGTNIIAALEDVERIDCINHILNRVLTQTLEDKHAPKPVSGLLRSLKILVHYLKKNKYT